VRSWFRNLILLFTGRFKPPQTGPNRSRLVGMYLSSANGLEDAASERQRTRERRNGRFAQSRRR
jgi:hypothetical protein